MCGARGRPRRGKQHPRGAGQSCTPRRTEAGDGSDAQRGGEVRGCRSRDRQRSADVRGDEQLGDHPQGVDRGPPHVLGRQRRVDDPDGCLKALRKPLHPVQAVPVDPDPQLLDSHAGHGRPNRETVGLFDTKICQLSPSPTGSIWRATHSLGSSSQMSRPDRGRVYVCCWALLYFRGVRRTQDEQPASHRSPPPPCSSSGRRLHPRVEAVQGRAFLGIRRPGPCLPRAASHMIPR